MRLEFSTPPGKTQPFSTFTPQPPTGFPQIDPLSTSGPHRRRLSPARTTTSHPVDRDRPRPQVHTPYYYWISFLK